MSRRPFAVAELASPLLTSLRLRIAVRPRAGVATSHRNQTMKAKASSSSGSIDQAYALARERYAALGVDTERAMNTLSPVSISIHCWQGDDLGGFESAGGEVGGGLAVTGNYPGKARTPQELRADFEKAASLIPGRHRISLHATYGEMSGKKVERDALTIDQFKNWVAWAKEKNFGLDFNQTFFSHPKAADGFTITHPDRKSTRLNSS